MSNSYIVWGCLGIAAGCILVKSSEYIYPQVYHYDDRVLCQDYAQANHLDYKYSAYKDACVVQYNDEWMSAKHYEQTYSLKAIEAQKRLDRWIEESAQKAIDNFNRQYEESRK